MEVNTEEYLKKNNSNELELSCMDIIAPKDNWVVTIGNKEFSLEYLKKNDVWNRKPKFDEVASRIYVIDKRCDIDNIDALFFYQYVNIRPLYCFTVMQEQCLENSKLLYGYAEKLCGRSVEVICRHIFRKRGIAEEFVDLFYTMFFPIYLKRNHNWFTLSLLVRARVAYPVSFHLLVQCLIKDVTIPNQILLDYAATCDEENFTELMRTMMRYNLNHVEFCHNLKLMIFLFTNCVKNEQTFKYVLLHMEVNASCCSVSKDYGKLLLVVMEVFSNFNTRHGVVRELIEKHGSPYKAACLAILDDMVEEMLRLQHQLLPPGPRFFIPREPAPSLL